MPVDTFEYKIINLIAKNRELNDEVKRLHDEFDRLEQDIVRRGKTRRYSKVKFEGTPYQDTCYYMYSYVEAEDIKKAFNALRDRLDQKP